MLMLIVMESDLRTLSRSNVLCKYADGTNLLLLSSNHHYQMLILLMNLII